jgi:hypothetical protein
MRRRHSRSPGTVLSFALESSTGLVSAPSLGAPLPPGIRAIDAVGSRHQLVEQALDDGGHLRILFVRTGARAARAILLG